MKPRRFRAAFLATIIVWLFCHAAAPAQEGEVRPRSAAELCAEAEAMADQDDLEGAVRRFGAALDLEPGHAGALLGRAQAKHGLRRYAAARRDLDELIAASPEHTEALVARGRVHLDLGDHERAEADFGRAATFSPGDARILDLHGYALYLGDHNGPAVVVLERSLRLDPASAFTLDLLATVELELGRLPSALRHVDAAIAIDPDVAEYHHTRSRILSAQGRPLEAARAAARARELDPASRSEGELPPVDFRGLLNVLGVLVGVLVFFSLIGLAMSGSARTALEYVPKGHTPARYDGRAGDLFRIYLQNVVLTVLTLGIYKFWAKVRMTRYHHQHTSFAGGRFDYHATGAEKFAGFCKGMLILAPLAGAIYLACQLLVPPEAAFAVGFWAFVLVLFLLRPLILVASQRFNLSRTTWSNLRLRFTGRVGAAYRLYLTDLLLIVCTLGIYTVWHQCNVRRFRMRHTQLGDHKFGYHGQGGELFAISVGGMLLCYLTLGLYVPWYIAGMHRFHVTNTSFDGRRFQSRLRGGHVVALGAPALLAIVLTLGLAIPWALNRWWRLTTDTTSYAGAIDVDKLRAVHDAGAAATIEGVGEAGEALAELGDLLGA